MVETKGTQPAAEPQTAEEKAVAARNIQALGVKHTAYVKIQAYTSVDESQGDSLLRAAEVFLAALDAGGITPMKADVEVYPPTESQTKKRLAEEKRQADEKLKAEKR